MSKKTYTIEQAIKRVKQITENSDAISDVVFLMEQDLQKYSISEITLKYESRHGSIKFVSVPVGAAIRMLEEAEQAQKAEAEKLMPVIEMANAALKGMEV